MYSSRPVLPSICFVVLAVFSAIVFSEAVKPSALPGTSRIVNGWKTTIDKVPYIVQLRDDGGRPAYCGGTLVAPKYVITAAHCFMSREQERVRIFAGTNERRGQSGIERGIAKLTIHPEYSLDTLHTDIAIIELDAEMPLGRTIDILPLCTAPVRPGELVDVSGWGNTGKELWSVDLLTVRLSVTTREVCEDLYWMLAGKNTFCAGGGSEAKGSCTGDSGGPVVYGGELCGIVSIGSRCDTATRPSAYTDVYAVRSFVQSVIPQLF